MSVLVAYISQTLIERCPDLALVKCVSLRRYLGSFTQQPAQTCPEKAFPALQNEVFPGPEPTSAVLQVSSHSGLCEYTARPNGAAQAPVFFYTVF